MEQRTRERKEIQRARRDSLSGQPRKKAKLDLEHRRRSNPSEDGRASTSSKSSKCSGTSNAKKTLQVRIGKRSQTVVSQKSPSPRKTGHHRRGSTSSSAPSDRSGRRTNLASQGEVRVTVPNEQDPMRAGPPEQRLAWEEPEPLGRAEPTKCARDATAWVEVCPATDFETGQLIGRVGTPEEPLFTYEQAVHHRRGRDDLQLVVGKDIPTEERDDKKGTLDCGLTLDQDGQWEDPAGAYKRLRLPTYHHSVPVQELMRSHRWPAFREGRWGNRPNPPVPEGDVRPPRAVTAAQPRLDAIELPPAATSGNPTIPVHSPIMTAQPAPDFVPSSDREELAEEEMELTVPASPPRTNALRQVPSRTEVAAAVTNMAAHLRKTGAPSTSTVTSSQRDSQASGTGTRDSSLGRIPRVSARESNPLRTASSHHGRSGHRDRTRLDRPPVFPAHETTLK